VGTVVSYQTSADLILSYGTECVLAGVFRTTGEISFPVEGFIPFDAIAWGSLPADTPTKNYGYPGYLLNFPVGSEVFVSLSFPPPIGGWKPSHWPILVNYYVPGTSGATKYIEPGGTFNREDGVFRRIYT
jgi:hypothetical protein